jgi:hypothetical protein
MVKKKKKYEKCKEDQEKIIEKKGGWRGEKEGN